MSSGTKTTKSSTGSFSIGGQQVASSSLGPNGYSTNINLNPSQQATWNTANSGISSALGDINSILATTPAQEQTYANQLYQPMANQINTDYTQAADQAYNKAGSMGGLNSVGFNRYNDNILTKNQDLALTNAQNVAQTQAYNLPNMLLSPISNALSMYSNAQGNIFNQSLGLAQDSSTGQQLSNNYNTANNLFNGGSGSGNFFSSYNNFINPLGIPGM